MHLALQLTPSCNLRCGYCFTPPRYGEPMSEEVAFAALDMVVRLNRGPVGVTLTGGEPLLARDLVRSIVLRAREMEGHGGPRFVFRLLTNGLLLDEDFLRWADQRRVTVAMSFDGTRAAHDTHRHFPDGSSTYDLLAWRLRALLHRGRRAAVLLTVAPRTAVHLSASVEELVRMGARVIVVTPDLTVKWTPAQLEELERQLVWTGETYLDRARAGRPLYLSPFELHTDDVHTRWSGNYHQPPCKLGRERLAVDTRGDVYPGVAFFRAGPTSRWHLGTVLTDVSERLRRLVHSETLGELEGCADGPDRGLARARCGCLNWLTTGFVDRVPEALCAYDKLLVPVADRVREQAAAEGLPSFLPPGPLTLDERMLVAGPL